HGHRNEENHDLGHEPALRLCHSQTPVFRILWPDGNKVLILSEPRNRVEKKITVTLQTECAVGRKIGSAKDKQTAFLVLAQILGGHGRQGYGSLEIRLLIEGRFIGLQIRLTPTSFVR